MSFGAVFAKTYRREVVQQSRLAFRPREAPVQAQAKVNINNKGATRDVSTVVTPPNPSKDNFVKAYGCDNVRCFIMWF